MILASLKKINFNYKRNYKEFFLRNGMYNIFFQLTS